MSISPATASPVIGPTALAISPHLDDAVFSAGGTLAMLARNGWQVVVATAFTLSVPNPRGFALACQLDKGLAADVDYMALRRAEDRKACAVLGAQPVWMPYPEAPHRGYDDAQALFAGQRNGDTIVRDLAPALADVIASLAPSIVFAPQAIGGHVDHIALVEALNLIDLPPTLWWRDYPYTERQDVTRTPFADHFGAKTETCVAIDMAARDSKIAASLAYCSQIGFQFGGEIGLRQRMDKIGAELFRSDDVGASQT